VQNKVAALTLGEIRLDILFALSFVQILFYGGIGT